MELEHQQLEQVIVALEAQRSTLGDAVVETGLALMRERLAALAAPPADPQRERRLATVILADVEGPQASPNASALRRGARL